MPLVASATSGGTSTPAPAGTHVARCVRVIDLGTQKDIGQFGLKIQPKLMLSFELPNELHVFREENGEEPFLVSKEYTLNLGEKSNLRKDLESWRGRPFNEDELVGFDVSKLLNKACLLNVIHKPNSSGGISARIASITPLVKGMVCPPAILKCLVYDVDQGRNDTYGELPEWIRKKIDQCENWKRQESPEQAAHHAADDAAATAADDIPF